MRIEDLRKLLRCSRPECKTKHLGRVTESELLTLVADLNDLVEVLKERGSETVWRCWENVILGEQTPADWVPHLKQPSYCLVKNGHKTCGWILVVLLDGHTRSSDG